jgi:hypothetical protein
VDYYIDGKYNILNSLVNNILNSIRPIIENNEIIDFNIIELQALLENIPLYSFGQDKKVELVNILNSIDNILNREVYSSEDIRKYKDQLFSLLKEASKSKKSTVDEARIFE